MNGAEIITAVLDDGGFDVSRAKALEWLNQRQRRMIAETRWRLAEQQIATTVAKQAAYDIPADLVDMDSLWIVAAADAKQTWYERTGERTMRKLNAKQVSWGGQPAFAPFFKADGTAQIQLYPAPALTGDSIMALTAAEPLDITDDTVAAHGPVIPVDLHQYLRDGAIATGYALIEERGDTASYFEQQFTTGVELLHRRKNSRIGSGPSQMKVAGWTA